MGLRVVILGSYRKHFDLIDQARKSFALAGYEVVLPVGEVVDSTKDFVPLSSDKPGLTPAEVEAEAVDQALNAAFAYFVCHDGYIGRTASYELGRLMQAGKRLYFSQQPIDLPVAVPKGEIISVDALILGLKNGTIKL
jgi:hypothetical protein